MSDEVEIEMPTSFCPVAEYLSICILEGAGEQPAHWKGTDYTTDGRCYLIADAPDPKMREITIVPSQDDVTAEHAAKLLIEQIVDLNGRSTKPKHYLTFMQVLEMLEVDPDYLTQHKGWIASGGRFEWDEDQGVFTRYEPSMFGQGKIRHAR